MSSHLQNTAFLVLLLVFAIGCGADSAPSQEEAKPPEASAPIGPGPSSTDSTPKPKPPPRLRTVDFYGESIGRDTKYNILVPRGYDKGNLRYPVLYVLHGSGGTYRDWTRFPLQKITRGMHMIIVMPDVGNSRYLNWAESEEGQKNEWEDFMIHDLIEHVDANFRTIPTRGGRAITGISMGGAGAFVLGLKHPDMFCSLGSISGSLGLTRLYEERLRNGDEEGFRLPRGDWTDSKIGLPDFDSQEERRPKGKLFTTPEQCRANDPFELVKQVAPELRPHLFLACGKQDRLIGWTREFFAEEIIQEYSVIYEESPGGHDTPYWMQVVHLSIPMHYRLLQQNLEKRSG